MRFAKWVFGLAGIYGLLVTIPLYVLERRTGEDSPPAITHPEYYYGFAGLCLAWQVMFLIIAIDPIRFRLAMLVGVLEKLGFVIPISILYYLGRVHGSVLGFAMMDAMLAALFTVAFVRTKASQAGR